MATVAEREARRRLMALMLSPTFFAEGVWATGRRRLAAAWWTKEGQAWVGLWEDGDTTVWSRAPTHRLALPDRAHGLSLLSDGSVLVVSRRPGPWLLRWRPGAAKPTYWQEAEDQRAFAGHVFCAGDRCWTTEIEEPQGTGWITCRRLSDLQPIATWPTGGQDPHMLHSHVQGQMVVLHGGVPRPPFPGAAEFRGRLDSKLSVLDAQSGRYLGDWRLQDPHLSLRHLAWHPSGVMGIGLQAHHADPAQRLTAPILALWDGRTLREAQAGQALGGYAGDLCATPEGFMVAATRAPGSAEHGGAGAMTDWSLSGEVRGQTPWPEACALQWTAGQLWAPHREGPGGTIWDNHLGLALHR